MTAKNFGKSFSLVPFHTLEKCVPTSFGKGLALAALKGFGSFGKGVYIGSFGKGSS